MNPQKEYQKIELQSHHRVVVVVFIPKLQDYYLNMFEVFKLCLESLLLTKNEFCEITIVNNGSCLEVSEYLNKIYSENKIDCLINHRKNIGKIDALVGAARSSREKFITTTDADILFVKGWQENVESIFYNFKNVGSVSPIPIRTGYTSGTFSTLQKVILGKVRLQFVPIKENFASYNKFLESIGWDLETKDDLLWPIISNSKAKAILGSAHQVLTLDRTIFFTDVPIQPSLTLVGNNSEHDYIDTPIDLSGKMRLATYRNFAYHMGNKVENWMYEVQKDNTIAIENKTKYSIQEIISKNPETTFKTNIFKLKKIFVKWYFKRFLLK